MTAMPYGVLMNDLSSTTTSVMLLLLLLSLVDTVATVDSFISSSLIIEVVFVVNGKVVFGDDEVVNVAVLDFC